ncbi:MAG: hypothetical protein IT258_15870 [Saprospiraceae bacterium]|nr:hypothetical protein [Saprospiraceae bacterium]
MKKFPFLLLAIGLFLFACKDEKPIDNIGEATNVAPPANLKPDEDGISTQVQVVDSLTGQVSMASKPVASLSAAIGANPIIKQDPNKPVPVPPKPQTPQQERIVRVLCSNYWIVQGLRRINDSEASRANPGAWFKFRPDGSYDYGYMKNTIGTGAWSIDGKAGTVHCDAPLVGDDREWKMQIAKSEDVMVWVGTDRYRTTSISAKLINLLFIPKNRKEIGIDW